MLTINRCYFAMVFVFCFFYLFFLQLQAIWPFTIDDMYISLRYAQHWAEGFGLVWNIGQAPVEGYSNFSFVAVGHWLIMWGLNPVTGLKSLGILSLGVTVAAVYFISRFWFLPRLAVISCFWLLSYQGQVLWSASGLETSFYEALVCGFIFFIYRGLGFQAYPSLKRAPQPKAFFVAGVMLAVASMTRPEAPVFAGVVLLMAWFHRPSKNSWPYWRTYLIFLGIFIAIYTPYFLWRWAYFGQLLPNPVYCKGYNNVLNLALDKNYIQLIWPFAILAVVGCWKNKSNYTGLLWLPSAVYLVLLIGADPIVAFDNRLFLPSFALLLPLALLGLSVALKYWLKKDDVVLDIALYMMATFLLFFCIPHMGLKAFRQYTTNPVAGEKLRHEVIDWLQQYTPTKSHVVLADCGLIPYKNTRSFTDSYCLNNAAMSKFPKKTMYRQSCKQILRDKPDVIILTSLFEHGKVIYTPTDVCFASKLQNNKHYQLQANLKTGTVQSFYQYEIYQRKGH